MSILETPRIYFKGNISWDPVTTNNFPPANRKAAYDEDDCESTLDAKIVGSGDSDKRQLMKFHHPGQITMV